MNIGHTNFVILYIYIHTYIIFAFHISHAVRNHKFFVLALNGQQLYQIQIILTYNEGMFFDILQLFHYDILL